MPVFFQTEESSLWILFLKNKLSITNGRQEKKKRREEGRKRGKKRTLCSKDSGFHITFLLTL